MAMMRSHFPERAKAIALPPAPAKMSISVVFVVLLFLLLLLLLLFLENGVLRSSAIFLEEGEEGGISTIVEGYMDICLTRDGLVVFISL
jgi:hypothetical protein